MATLRFSRIAFNAIPAHMPYQDQTIFQTAAWMKFIAQAQHADPVKAILYDGDCQKGVFSGLVMKKFGLRILGSPFPGWTTAYMGFNLDPSISHVEALTALETFAFGELRCVHLEIMDRRITENEFQEAGYRHRNLSGFEIDLTRSEDDLFTAMDPACRRCIRKGVKGGLQAERTGDPTFIDEYYGQLTEVFAKQKLVPTYTKERVRLLIDHLLPTGNILLARVRDSEGRCIATGIFPAYHDTMFFWGGASLTEFQHLRPNEMLHWFAMRYWKGRGIRKYDMGGDGDYKKKYGGYNIFVPWGRKSKYPFIENLRAAGKRVFTIKQRMSGLIVQPRNFHSVGTGSK